MVSLTNQAESDGLLAAMLEYHLAIGHNYWIGLSKSDQTNYGFARDIEISIIQNYLRWSDGSALNSDSWMNWAPNAMITNQNCVVVS